MNIVREKGGEKLNGKQGGVKSMLKGHVRESKREREGKLHHVDVTITSTHLKHHQTDLFYAV